MGDQHGALNAMHLDQEAQLLDQCFFFPEGHALTREAGSAARHRQAVVTREFQGVVEEVVELFPKAAVATINGRRADAVFV